MYKGLRIHLEIEVEIAFVVMKKYLRSFTSIALRIPTAHNFTRDQRPRIKKMATFSLTGPRHRRKCSQERAQRPITFFCCFILSNTFLSM